MILNTDIDQPIQRSGAQGVCVTVQSGLIRSEQAVVNARLFGGDISQVELVAYGVGRARIGAWPFDLDESLTAEEAGTPIWAASALPPNHPPVVSFEVEIGGGEVQYEPGYQLKALFYATREAFSVSQVARNRKVRPADGETELFLAEQMADHHMQPETLHDCRELLPTMVAAFSYRALDLRRRDKALKALAKTKQLMEFLEAQPRSEYFDTAKISTLTIRWHLEAFIGDFVHLVECLEKIKENSQALYENDRAYILSYNVSRGLCVLMAVYFYRGDRAALESTRTALIGSLRAAGRVMTLYPAHLAEFASTCRLVMAIEPLMAHYDKAVEADPAMVLDSIVPNFGTSFQQVLVDKLIAPAARIKDSAWLAGEIIARLR